ncbi:MAG: ATP-binding cassette domain-containing protein [Magnetococcus sp. DMHC-6]
MALLTVSGLRVKFGGPWILEGVNLVVQRGERVSLVGRNGAGKSTLMKVIAGSILPDEGTISLENNACVAYLEQTIPEHIDKRVFHVVAQGLGPVGDLLARHRELSAHPPDTDKDGEWLTQLTHIQQELDACGGWKFVEQVETLLTRMGLQEDRTFHTLSGGFKRRVLLARALVNKPDLLLLDEPTNHLDIHGIEWLETFLLSWGGTLLFISHDRTCINRLATRIIDLDRGVLSSWPGNLDDYIRLKEAALEIQERAFDKFDRKLAQEEGWIRQGIKARRTRNEGRVRALEALRRERAQRRNTVGQVLMHLNEGERSGKLVVEVENIQFGYQNQLYIRNFSTQIMRGDKIGIIGPNGSGKTTLLNLLLGRLPPDQGQLRLGTRLSVAYFDQMRGELELEKTVIDNVANGRQQLTVDGKSRHVISYLKDFLFTPEAAISPVKVLSGGERNRLLLAKLFLEPANMLVLDEPTNDLDMETLELLEFLLVSYSGTVLVVSHDRAFLNNVVTQVLVFEGDGRIAEYVGGYDDWVRQRPVLQPIATKTDTRKKTEKSRPLPPEKNKRLGYKERLTLEALPGKIEALEIDLAELQKKLSDPSLYQKNTTDFNTISIRLDETEKALQAAYEQWQQLELLAN